MLGSTRSGGIHEKHWGGVVWGSICSLFTNSQSLESTSCEWKVIKSELHKGLRAYRFTLSKGTSIIFGKKEKKNRTSRPNNGDGWGSLCTRFFVGPFVSCSSSWGTLSSSCFLVALKGDVVLGLALPPPSPSHLADTSPFCFASPPEACWRGGGARAAQKVRACQWWRWSRLNWNHHRPLSLAFSFWPRPLSPPPPSSQSDPSSHLTQLARPAHKGVEAAVLIQKPLGPLRIIWLCL